MIGIDVRVEEDIGGGVGRDWAWERIGEPREEGSPGAGEIARRFE